MTDANAASAQPRIALVGCGRWGRNIARTLARLGALEIIVDPETDRLQAYADELGCRVSADLTEVFAAEIDGVAVAAPAVDHAALVRMALEAGKPVFVEKPLALDSAEAESLAALANDRGLGLMVGHLLQYHPAFVKLKELLDDGVIGDLRHISSNRLNPGAIRTEENALWSLAPHDFSMVLGLVAESEPSITALSASAVNAKIPDWYTVQLRFSETVTAQVNVSWLSPYKEHKLTVLGTKGALVFEDTASDKDRKLMLYRDYVDTSAAGPMFIKRPGEPVPYAPAEPLEEEMRTFLACVRGEGASRTGPDEAVPVLRLLERSERAARASA